MAETPPPFRIPSPPTPPRQGADVTKTCLLVGGVLGGLCLVGGVGMFFMVRGVWGEVSKTVACTTTFEVSRTALLAYAKVNDGKLPAAATWQTDIKPYYDRLATKMEMNELPKEFRPHASTEAFTCGGKGAPTNIAFNKAIGGKKLTEIENPTKTPLLFETPTPAKVNLTEDFVERPKSQAPKMMQSERNWIVFYVEGTENPFANSSQGAPKLDLKPEDALPEPPAPPSPPAR